MKERGYITTLEFTQSIFNRLNKYRYVIIVSAVVLGLLLAIYAKNAPATYTSRAVIFSSSTSNDNSSANSAISMLLGVEGASSFNNETSINIIELAQSRAISEAVASSPVPSMGNKLIAELLIDSNNNHRGLFTSRIVPPTDKEQLISLGVLFLRAGIAASINKNNSFVLTYTGKSEEMVKIISYELINKISGYYIDLKREKAKRDYEFASAKVDSLRRVMGAKDNTLIARDRRTLFTNTDRLEYSLPTQNLVDDKQLLRNQYSQAVINQQSAAYKLQKDTPLINVLDKPDPPFDTKGKSTLLYGILGLLAGAMMVAGLIISGQLLRFTRQEIMVALFGKPPSTSATITTTA